MTDPTSTGQTSTDKAQLPPSAASTKRPPLGLVAVVLVLVGLVLVFGPRDAGSDHADRVSGPSATAPSPPTSPATASSPSPAGEVEATQEASQLQEQRTAVSAFAAAFAGRSPHQVWLDALAGHVTPDMLEGFAYTDPQLRPAGNPTTVTHLAPGDRFQLEFTSGEQMICTVTADPSGTWLVNSLEPVRSPVPTGSDV